VQEQFGDAVKAPVLAIALGARKGAGGDPEGDEGDDERDPFDAFADAAGIPDEKRDDAYEALRSMIQTCVRKAKEGSYSDEES
jgi:hypothetical protein